MNRNARSDALHRAVRSFASGDGARSFCDLALDIAEFQREFSAGFARLVSARGGLRGVSDIPGVPSDAFRVTRVALQPEGEDRLRFRTSGTTSGQRGAHALRTVETYRALALNLGRQALIAGRAPHVVALAPPPEEPPTSSLGYMMTLFMNEFDPGSIAAEKDASRWLFDHHGVSLTALERAVAVAEARDTGVLLLATSFALVSLLDALGGSALRLPASSVVMPTGGSKGKTREVEAGDLRRGLARTFSISEAQIVSEYGMTELTSQLYEATLPGSALHRDRPGQPGSYREPPWLRVIPVDPVTLDPVPDGEVGIARIVDLGNVDSAIAVQTQDCVRRVRAENANGANDAGDIVLLGRAPGAVARGCSLAIEEFLAAVAR